MNDNIRERLLERFARLKQGPVRPADVIPLAGVAGRLVPVTAADAADPAAVALFARWREGGASGFPTQFPVTLEGTARWAQKGLMEVPDRVLFWVETPDREKVGHVGLFRLDEERRAIEVDNIVRGEPHAAPGIMLAAVRALNAWAFAELGLHLLFLRVFADNARAVRLYERCGFEEIVRVPMARTEDGPVTSWAEVDGRYRDKVTRYFVTMRLARAG